MIREAPTSISGGSSRGSKETDLDCIVFLFDDKGITTNLKLKIYNIIFDKNTTISQVENYLRKSQIKYSKRNFYGKHVDIDSSLSNSFIEILSFDDGHLSSIGISIKYLKDNNK